LVVPVIFEEPALGVVVVVEAPRHKMAAVGVEDEPLLVLGDFYPRHVFGLCGNGRAGRGEAEKNGQTRMVSHYQFPVHPPSGTDAKWRRYWFEGATAMVFPVFR